MNKSGDHRKTQKHEESEVQYEEKLGILSVHR